MGLWQKMSNRFASHALACLTFIIVLFYLSVTLCVYPLSLWGLDKVISSYLCLLVLWGPSLVIVRLYFYFGYIFYISHYIDRIYYFSFCTFIFDFSLHPHTLFMFFYHNLASAYDAYWVLIAFVLILHFYIIFWCWLSTSQCH